MRTFYGGYCRTTERRSRAISCVYDTRTETGKWWSWSDGSVRDGNVLATRKLVGLVAFRRRRVAPSYCFATNGGNDRCRRRMSRTAERKTSRTMGYALLRTARTRKIRETNNKNSGNYFTRRRRTYENRSDNLIRARAGGNPPVRADIRTAVPYVFCVLAYARLCVCVCVWRVIVRVCAPRRRRRNNRLMTTRSRPSFSSVVCGNGVLHRHRWPAHRSAVPPRWPLGIVAYDRGTRTDRYDVTTVGRCLNR